ncbi:MAG: hypothetical protein ACK5O8_06200 [Pirellula sp.]|jgi:hypothetical protein
MPFVYDIKIRGLIDRETGDRLLFERVLPESATHVSYLVCRGQQVPFLATLTWDSTNPPRAVWCVEHLGKNLLGQVSIVLTPEFREIVEDTITRALLSHSADHGPEFDGARVQFQQ